MSPLSNPSQLIVRNIDLLEVEQLLIFNAFTDNLLTTVCQHAKCITAFTSNFASYQNAQKVCATTSNHTVNHHIGPWYNEAQTFDAALLFFPKSKKEFLFNIENIFAQLKSDGVVYVVGDNKGGVKSLPKLLKEYTVSVDKIDSARHCSLFAISAPKEKQAFEPEDWFSKYSFNVANTELDIYALPGVFSQTELDEGTKLLLETLATEHKTPLSGKILDFGCGAGVISAWLAKNNPKAQVTAVDVSALAVASTQKTLMEQGLDGEVFLSDGLSEITQNYHYIVSNPPFHDGVKTRYDMTEQFLRDAKSHLNSRTNKSHGLYIVANSFLKYPPIIEKTFGQCLCITKTKKFSIYQA
ncbi:16S rRNA (guanine(1207)-N(2))-methyltransferase RsmC [Flocculibacter collagenilyticus]|uniref:16S rRNA (guanine(1207)-N(2))-methyltransferase RsmC n=1 Tax=Flocculibacter collagenilyticus TaxID=2744479 RepID=UPI0018F76880|nr:16S rRNA (guanine(1207)-N(2))-methyltransferase RsmC [Flocculibacter collagenilyticus]